ncbi:hypothetical protein R6Z07M_007970 [Ovis aries]|uniref:PX domain-containing protein n=1 Tax=Ovis ammon polii TaxID=230172 RepID=A0AAD4U7U1_OVIAM|nr:hypothetical protein MG293_009102 [Ovis ammon polii]
MPTDRRTHQTEASCVQRRCSDCECLKNELQRDSKIVVPPLPGKALKRQLPIGGDEGIFEESLIEERRQGLQFINKTAGHPLAPNERCLHMFLQEEATDRNCPREAEVRQLILEALQQVNLDVRECGQLARSGPVSGFQEDTLQLAFIDLRKDPGE